MNKVRKLYSTDGKGRWTVRTWRKQCGVEKVVFYQNCQGTEGHEGDHWCYGADGSLCLDHPDGSASIVPPSHNDYVPPGQMADRHFLNFSTLEEVIDTELIAKLEAGWIPDGASVTRPA